MIRRRASPSRPPCHRSSSAQRSKTRIDELRAREKAHTREGDAVAAARRRLPMVEVDPALALKGPTGSLTLLDAFEGRTQLVAYYFMWYPGNPAAEQCEGCTLFTTQVSELSYLHSRDITFASRAGKPGGYSELRRSNSPTASTKARTSSGSWAT